MKRFKQRGAWLAMALGLFASMTCAGETVSSSAGGWFAVDAREVKDTTWEGGVIVAGETNIVLQCSSSAWGAAVGGAGVTVAYRNDTTGAAGTIAETTTEETVDWTPNGSGTFVLTHTVVKGDDSVVLTATFMVPFQVGDKTWAVITNGVCTLSGTGETWWYDKAGASPLYAYSRAITNVVVQEGVTGIGSRFFENMWYLTDVTLGESVTEIGARAFKKCYGLTNVTSQATEASSVGEYAFSGCHSLQGLSFAGDAEFGTQAYTMQAAIYMREGGIPEVYAVPKINIKGKSECIKAKKTLKDATWTDVTNFSDEDKKPYHFFKIEME